MAKRRKLEAPSVEDLQRIEDELIQTPVARAAPAPIAQVAAEAASAFDPRPAAVRAEAAKDRLEAESFRAAQANGLLLLDLAIDEIDADALVRDRVVIDAEELEELKSAIARNGLRLPIEVFRKADGGYGLLSGYRRLMAVRALKTLTQDERYDRIKSVLRDPEAMGGSFAAMVEENEIRASLSHYERGRIAVIAAQQGAFSNTEAAVDALFPVASKAKRSKIRSFALIFEELGDMLSFPDLIKEKDGLRLAAALRDGAEAKLREALAQRVPQHPDEEALLINIALATTEPKAADPSRGGRPKRAEGPRATLASGVVLKVQQDAKGWMIRLDGPNVDRTLAEMALEALQQALDGDRS